MQPVEPVRLVRPRHHVPDAAAAQPVPQVRAGQQRRGWDDHRAEAQAGDDGLPQFDLVAEHDQHPVAACHPLPVQPGREPGRAVRDVGEGQSALRTVLLHHPQGGSLPGQSDGRFAGQRQARAQLNRDGRGQRKRS